MIGQLIGLTPMSEDARAARRFTLRRNALKRAQLKILRLETLLARAYYGLEFSPCPTRWVLLRDIRREVTGSKIESGKGMSGYSGQVGNGNESLSVTLQNGPHGDDLPGGMGDPLNL